MTARRTDARNDFISYSLAPGFTHQVVHRLFAALEWESFSPKTETANRVFLVRLLGVSGNTLIETSARGGSLVLQ
jgi:hypothetical protein